MDVRFCPSCKSLLEMKSKEIYNYDPIVLVEEIFYQCTQCHYEEKVEYLKQLKE